MPGCTGCSRCATGCHPSSCSFGKSNIPKLRASCNSISRPSPDERTGSSRPGAPAGERPRSIEAVAAGGDFQSEFAPSTINVRLSAIRKLASQAAEAGLLSNDLASGIQRLKGARKLGVRAGNWLTKEQASELLHSPDTGTLKGKRDRALLALLIGCGLRRSEMAALSFENIEQREGRWVLPDLVGKGGRVRTVPLPAWVKSGIDAWSSAAGLCEGKVFRSIDKKGLVWGQGITAKVIWWVVLRYAKKVGIPKLAPHDLRPARPCLHPNHRTISRHASESS